MNAKFQINEITSQAFMFRKFDKHQNLPFPYIQYIKFFSNKSIHQAYNIAISQVLPILYISSTNKVASVEILNLINTMISNNFYKPHLIKLL